MTAGVLGGMASLIEKLPAGAFRTRCMWTMGNLPEVQYAALHFTYTRPHSLESSRVSPRSHFLLPGIQSL